MVPVRVKTLITICLLFLKLYKVSVFFNYYYHDVMLIRYPYIAMLFNTNYE